MAAHPPAIRLTPPYYDNSANNPRNPDPGAEVHWGEQSWDEMMLGWFDVAISVPRPDEARSDVGPLPGRSTATVRR